MEPTEENIARAKRFALAMWKERATERGLDSPRNLSSACKFCALFARGLFGGEVRANSYHCWIERGGLVIDLTDGVDAETFGITPERLTRHNPRFARNREFRESLRSCKPRVKDWLYRFLTVHPEGFTP
jgi:hypothetical protein